MDLKLKGKVALVLGASTGLGFAVAQALAAEGVAVGLVSRHADKLTRATEAIKGKAGRAAFAAADAGDWAELEKAAASLESELGTPDILVSNSGGPPPVDATHVDAELWRKEFEALCLNQMRLAERLLPGMRARQFGRIIVISSTSIVEPFAALAISNALRAALAGWMKTLSSLVARDGVTVNLIVTGSFATERTEALDEAEARRTGVSVLEIARRAGEAIPAGRYGRPAEFGHLAAFLASPLAQYITGTAIRIDGGATRSL